MIPLEVAIALWALVVIKSLARLLHISAHLGNLSIHVLLHLTFRLAVCGRLSFRGSTRLFCLILLINSRTNLVIHLHALICLVDNSWLLLWADKESLSWLDGSLLSDELLLVTGKFLVALKVVCRVKNSKLVPRGNLAEKRRTLTLPCALSTHSLRCYGSVSPSCCLLQCGPVQRSLNNLRVLRGSSLKFTAENCLGGLLLVSLSPRDNVG